jgi:hypothetical protein
VNRLPDSDDKNLLHEADSLTILQTDSKLRKLSAEKKLELGIRENQGQKI